jgi:hydrogenase maturation protein HypF
MADIAPNLERIGVMLPSSPLLELIANDYQNPLIATSGNLSGSPIIHRDKDALTHLSLIADAVISYNREIIIPEDDSVIQVSRYSGQQIMLRRSRGFAPSFMQYIPQSEKTVLSTGAFLKSSFSLSVNGNVFVSQYLGTGLYYESEQMYKEVLDHWIQLYEIKPELILADLHPGYFSHQYAKTLSETYAADIKLVQHHEAHFSAVLAENDLLDTEDHVMGVIWDGTGLGRDGNIWGGEFFSYANKRMFRCYHFDYFPVITGDKMALEPRISAICACKDTWFLPDNLKEKFTGTEWNNYQTLIASSNLFSSSVGRIFDAVASLLDICDVQHYEGEAAMRLQLMAESYVEINGFSMDESYFKEESHYYRIPTASLLQGIIIDLKKERPRPYIAAKFHYSLVFLIAIVANNVKSRKICFSGGVFQNSLLADWIQHEYGGKFQLFFHKNLSPNDENISFGQLVYADNQIISGEIKTTAQKDSIINHY